MMVHTSHVESQGLAILEAMALKTPCVAVASMGPKEYLNSDLGILVGRDVNSVRDGVIRLLLQQYDATIVSKAYEVVKKYYSPDVIVRLLDGLVIDK
jgi:glycosyltransferase involved in cell wall biosynthesis